LKESIQAVKDAKEELEEAEIDENKDDIKKARDYLKDSLLSERQARASIYKQKVDESKKNYLEAKEGLLEAKASGSKSKERKAQKKLDYKYKKLERSKKKADIIMIMLVKKAIRSTRKELKIARKIGDLSAVDQLRKI